MWTSVTLEIKKQGKLAIVFFLPVAFCIMLSVYNSLISPNPYILEAILHLDQDTFFFITYTSMWNRAFLPLSALLSAALIVNMDKDNYRAIYLAHSGLAKTVCAKGLYVIFLSAASSLILCLSYILVSFLMSVSSSIPLERVLNLQVYSQIMKSLILTVFTAYFCSTVIVVVRNFYSSLCMISILFVLFFLISWLGYSWIWPFTLVDYLNSSSNFYDNYKPIKDTSVALVNFLLVAGFSLILIKDPNRLLKFRDF